MNTATIHKANVNTRRLRRLRHLLALLWPISVPIPYPLGALERVKGLSGAFVIFAAIASAQGRIVDAPVTARDRADLFRDFTASIHPGTGENLWTMILRSENPEEHGSVLRDQYRYRTAVLNGCTIEISFATHHEDFEQHTNEEEPGSLSIHLTSVDPSSVQAEDYERVGNSVTGTRIDWKENGQDRSLYADHNPGLGAKALKKLAKTCADTSEPIPELSENSRVPSSLQQEDAVRFLREKLKGNPAVWRTDGGVGTIGASNVELHNCKLLVHFSFNSGAHGQVLHSEDNLLIIDLSRVAPNTVAIRPWRGDDSIVIMRWEEDLKESRFTLSSAGDPERIVKAFTFLAKSCGGKDSAF